MLALLFVFPPDAIARLSCATLAMLSLPMPCCAPRDPVAAPAAKSCCCTPGADRSSDLVLRRSASVAKHAEARPPEMCCCGKIVPRDGASAPARDASPTNLSAWIHERADISARAVHFECLAPHARSHSDRDGPPPRSLLASADGGSTDPAAGCARHDLLSRGVVGLLTDFGTALL
jgi:hypothetical protein